MNRPSTGAPTSSNYVETVIIASVIQRLVEYYPSSAVAVGALVACCTITMGRPLDQTLDQDVETVLWSLLDLLMSKRDVKTETATNVAPEPKQVM